MDGRPSCAPSLWKEHFKIHYLTEKMRSQADPEFADLCDRVKEGKQSKEDIEFLNSRIRECPSEMFNENFSSRPKTNRKLYVLYDAYSNIYRIVDER